MPQVMGLHFSDKMFFFNVQALARRQLVELKNGRLAMIATAGMLHHYFLTGKGPIELISS
jgi:hypothetical protein